MTNLQATPGWDDVYQLEVTDPAQGGPGFRGPFEDTSGIVSTYEDARDENIKTRKLPICDVAVGHRSATVCHLGNIARWAGRKLRWWVKLGQYFLHRVALFVQERKQG